MAGVWLTEEFGFASMTNIEEEDFIRVHADAVA
jgi:hypothetical protein